MTSYPCNKYEQITPSYLLSVNFSESLVTSIKLALGLKERLYRRDLSNKDGQVVAFRGDTEMVNFFIGYCSGHFIFPIFLNPLSD